MYLLIYIQKISGKMGHQLIALMHWGDKQAGKRDVFSLYVLIALEFGAMGMHFIINK